MSGEPPGAPRKRQRARMPDAAASSLATFDLAAHYEQLAGMSEAELTQYFDRLFGIEDNYPHINQLVDGNVDRAGNPLPDGYFFKNGRLHCNGYYVDARPCYFESPEQHEHNSNRYSFDNGDATAQYDDVFPIDRIILTNETIAAFLRDGAANGGSLCYPSSPILDHQLRMRRSRQTPGISDHVAEGDEQTNGQFVSLIPDSEYADSDDEDQPLCKAQKINKDGLPRKGRQPRPKLLKWNENDWKNAILGIVWACGEIGLEIPFEQAAQMISGSCTDGALQQALLKLRGKQIDQGYQIPPLKMAWTRKNKKSTSASNTADEQNAQGTASSKNMLPKKKPTRMASCQAHMVTLKRAYKEADRQHLAFPYMFNKCFSNAKEKHAGIGDQGAGNFDYQSFFGSSSMSNSLQQEPEWEGLGGNHDITVFSVGIGGNGSIADPDAMVDSDVDADTTSMPVTESLTNMQRANFSSFPVNNNMLSMSPPTTFVNTEHAFSTNHPAPLHPFHAGFDIYTNQGAMQDRPTINGPRNSSYMAAPSPFGVHRAGPARLASYQSYNGTVHPDSMGSQNMMTPPRSAPIQVPNAASVFQPSRRHAPASTTIAEVGPNRPAQASASNSRSSALNPQPTSGTQGWIIPARQNAIDLHQFPIPTGRPYETFLSDRRIENGQAVWDPHANPHPVADANSELLGTSYSFGTSGPSSSYSFGTSGPSNNAGPSSSGPSNSGPSSNSAPVGNPTADNDEDEDERVDPNGDELVDWSGGRGKE